MLLELEMVLELEVVMLEPSLKSVQEPFVRDVTTREQKFRENAVLKRIIYFPIICVFPIFFFHFSRNFHGIML